MLLRHEQQYRGIPDWDQPDTDLHHNWGDYSSGDSLPTGVVYNTLSTGGTAGTTAFEGSTSGSRLDLTANATKWLRFDSWDITTPTSYRRVLFEIEGVYFLASTVVNHFFSIRDTGNLNHGLNWAVRSSGNVSEIAINKNTGSQTLTQTAFSPAIMGRNLKATIGVGYEIDPMTSNKFAILTYGNYVVWRKKEPDLSLGATLRPAYTLQALSGTHQVYQHGARLRLWRK